MATEGGSSVAGPEPELTAEEAGSWSRRLKGWALELGFDRVGITRLGPSRYRNEVADWLRDGHHAGMTYLARRFEERTDSRRLLHGRAYSAVCVAQRYFPHEDASSTKSGAPGRHGDPQVSDSLRTSSEAPTDLWRGVARYATGDDYHEVMTPRLWQLAERLQEQLPDVRVHAYVDTGPVLERELAQDAGLGVIAKNTMLLHRTGSWFLLGELLVSLNLEADQPATEDLCGSCTRCLDACPTQALEPYRLDARRCLSYWTIEHRGEIPEEIADRSSGWAFGCDICQEVCPWNHRLTELATEDRFRLPDHRSALTLVELADLRRERYLEAFRRSPLKRAKLEGLQRNARMALREGTELEDQRHRLDD